jgi:membrane dipeptidase
MNDALLTLDSHIDIPWSDYLPDRPLRADPDKLRAGGVKIGFYAAYVPQTARTPEGTQAACDRAVAMLHVIRGMGRLATTAAEIEAAAGGEATVIVAAVENGFAIGEDLDRLRQLRELGARYMTLTHNGHNALADSAVPRHDLGDPPSEHGGLSALGREAVGVMNRIGMVIDVSHVSKDAMLQAAALSRTPVVATHSCVRALCDHPRNMDDAQLDALRDVGGVIQITAVAGFLRAGAKPEAVTVADFADHVDYAVRRIGIAHVGISSDFDGGGGFAGWRDASQSANITAILLARGYGPAELALLWGGNFLRLLRAAEQHAA